MLDQPEMLQRKATLLPALTIEITLYVALGLVGVFIRLFFLGQPPLTSDEARQALASWNFLRGAPDGFTGSPFLFTGNAILFALFGATDTAARVLPGVFGSALVLLPALLRRELGRTGALIASLLLALSPSLVFFSRELNGAVIAVTCGFAALAFAWRFANDYILRNLLFAAASAALAFLAAREVWTIALATGLFVLATRRVKWSDSQLVADHATVRVRDYATVFVLVFLGVATTLLLHRDGIGAAFGLFGAWLEGLRPSVALFDPLNLLIVYEPMVLFFGVAALIQLAFIVFASKRFQLPLAALGFCAVVAFVLYSVGGDKDPARIVVLVVPLCLLAGWYVGDWLERAADATEVDSLLSQELPVFLLTCALGAFVYLVLAEFATRGSVDAADVLAAATGQSGNSGIIVLLLMLIAMAAVTFLAVTTVGWARARDIGMAVLWVLLSAWSIRQAVMLNFPQGGGLNAQEILVARVASLNVRDLQKDLEDASRWRANDSHALRVAVDESVGPVAAWYLREFRYAQFGPQPAETAEAQAILSSANAPAPASNWMSQRYRLEVMRGAEPIPGLFRWLLFRDVGATESVDVVLWMPAPQ